MKYFRWWVIFLGMAMIVGMLSSPPARAFDSSSAFNVVTMSYTANTTIYQRIVLDATQKQATNLTFSVDVKNGGGRPTQDPNGVPQAYASQTDSAQIYVKLYDSSGAVIATPTSQTYTLQNWGSNAGWSAAPGDNLLPWTKASMTYTGSLANVWFIEVYMKGTDGAWWAGNYGPEWRTPTVTIGSDASNVLYNPEFGIAPNSVKAQGWFNSSNTWAYCGVTSGSAPCVTNVTGVTANEWGGGYDANGGSLAGKTGGYDSVLTTSTADTAATTGDPTAGTTTTPTAPALCCGGSSASFNANQTNVAKVQAFVNRTTADSKINIEQIGNFNTTTIEQTGTKNNYVNYYVNGSSNTTTVKQSGDATTQVNYVDLTIAGSTNVTELTQTSTGGGKGIFATVADSNNNLKVIQSGSGNHYAEVNISGGNKTVDINQSGTAGHMASVTLSGQPTSLTLTQTGATQQFYSITHNCATAGGCAAITVTQGQ